MYLLPSSAAPDASTFSGIPRKILQKIKLNQEQNHRLTMMCLHERLKENTSKQKTVAVGIADETITFRIIHLKHLTIPIKDFLIQSRVCFKNFI